MYIDVYLTLMPKQLPFGQKWSAKIGMPEMLRFGKDDRTAVSIVYWLPTTWLICSIPMKVLFKVA